MNDKLNVCIINDSFPPLVDGIANTVVNYGRVINNGLGKATVCAPYYPDCNDSRFEFDVVRYPSIDTTGLVGYRAGVPFSAEIINNLKSRNFDIIHSHCPIASSMLGRVLREEINKPLVFTYHTKYDMDIRDNLRGHLIQESAIKALVDNVTASDEVWVVSEGAGKNLQSMGYEGDYMVMHNGVDFPKGRVDDDSIQRVTSQYDLPKDVPVYLFVGRIMWYKGIKIILDALKMLDEAGQDFRMVFIGNGQDKNEIQIYSRSLNLGKKVQFVDAIADRNELKAWYCRANLFLFPSTFDTNGLVVREAAACGLPSVLIKGSCAAEDTRDFVDSFWIDENANSLYSLLIHLGNNTSKMAAVGDAAQNNLYISWESSIKCAYERYGVVLDNYYSGRCPSHEKLSDHFFDKSAEAINQIIKIQAMNQKLLLQAEKDIAEIRTTIDNDKSNIHNKMKIEREKLENELKDRYDSAKAFILKELDRYK